MKGTKGYLLNRLNADAAGGGSAELVIYDFIGADIFGTGVSAKRVIEDLQALGKVGTLDVRISSPGGDVFEGIAIYNALARFDARVVVHVDALAASAASLVAMAGDSIEIADNAMLMVHRAWSVAIGDAPEIRRTADLLDKAWASMLTTYQARTGRKAATIEKAIDAGGGEWWMTAEEAVAAGFADEVVPATAEGPVFGLGRFARAPAKLAASAGDATVPTIATALPRTATTVAPRVVREPAADVEGQARRRRIVDVLGAGT